MEYLILIQVITFLLYVGYITKKFGVLPSISESYYRLGESKSILFYIFTVILCLTTMGYAGMFSSPWFFLSSAGFLFLGTGAAFKDWKVTNNVHYIGAVIAITFMLLGIGFEFEQWISLASFIFFSGLILLSGMKNYIFWTETVAFMCIILGLTLSL